MNSDNIHEATDVLEAAAVTYWVNKMAQGDTVPDENRVVPSVYVRNHAEYAGVAAGQLSMAHFLWAIFAHIFFVPWIIGTFGLCVLLPLWGPTNMAPNTQLLVGIGGLLLWIYVCLWWPLKLIVRTIYRKGPGIAYADGYKGPTGNGETTYTTRYRG